MSTIFTSLVAFAALISPTISSQVPISSDTKGPTKPNFVFIVTDDQDLHLNSLDYLPLVQKHLRDEGTFYQRHFCTIAVCCPSRVSLWTGKAAHNTNVTAVMPPYGGYPKFISQGLNDNYLPVWLQEAGYHTYYTGKFLNAHSTTNYNKPFPNAWTGSDFLVDPSTYLYWNATFQRNKNPPRNFPGEYNTDLVRDRALGFLDEAHELGEPFFLAVAPIAPHAETVITREDKIQFRQPKPATRHEGLFHNVTVPRVYNWNPDRPSLSDWIAKLPQQSEAQIVHGDYWHRARIQSLQAVDELVDSVFEKLGHYGLLDNTYVFYTSDNGYHIGQHRLQPGKGCAIEEDINVPFLVRGPGVGKGKTVDLVTTHTDIAPTILDLAGIPLRNDFDGAPIPIKSSAILEQTLFIEHVNVEFWSPGLCGEGQFCETADGKFLFLGNGTYKTLRLIGEGYNFLYTVWCSGGHELFDMNDDQGQLHNLAKPNFPVKPLLGRTIHHIQDRLDALLLVLKSCKGDVCRKPWLSLHPNGEVTKLSEALDKKYDTFYTGQPKVAFTECFEGYIIEAEGPQEAKAYDYDLEYLLEWQ